MDNIHGLREEALTDSLHLLLHELREEALTDSLLFLFLAVKASPLTAEQRVQSSPPNNSSNKQ
jgi:hypothetical protein